MIEPDVPFSTWEEFFAFIEGYAEADDWIGLRDALWPMVQPEKYTAKRMLETLGWVRVSESDATTISNAGIKVFKDETTRLTLVPKWADEMLAHPHYTAAMLRKASRSVTYRKEVLMEHRLVSKGATNDPTQEGHQP
jgi:hypothetical protein